MAGSERTRRTTGGRRDRAAQDTDTSALVAHVVVSTGRAGSTTRAGITALQWAVVCVQAVLVFQFLVMGWGGVVFSSPRT
jgi:hypothetical protein